MFDDHGCDRANRPYLRSVQQTNGRFPVRFDEANGEHGINNRDPCQHHCCRRHYNAEAFRSKRRYGEGCRQRQRIEDKRHNSL